MNHPTRGTCNNLGCVLRGLCHCGCGAKANISGFTQSKEGYVKGQPYIYRTGHFSRTPIFAHDSGFGDPVVHARTIASRTSKLCSRDPLRPLARWLIRQYGFRGGALVADMNPWMLRSIAYDKRKRHTSREVAQKIQQAVLSHRPQWKQLELFDQWENGYTRTPSPQELRWTRNNPRREKDRLKQRKRRRNQEGIPLHGASECEQQVSA